MRPSITNITDYCNSLTVIEAPITVHNY